MTVLRAGTAALYLATGPVIKVSRTSAVLAADLDDDQGRRIATLSAVTHLMTASPGSHSAMPGHE